MGYYEDDDEYFDEIESALKKRYGDDSTIEESRESASSDIREKRKLSPRERKIHEAKIKQKKKLLKKKARRKKIIKAIVITLTIILLFGLFLIYTKPGNKLLLRGASIYAKWVMKEDKKSSEFEAPKSIPDGWKYDKNVVNVLLVGIEEIGGARNTDSMILISTNKKTGKMTMVSLLRDTYVDIYGVGVKRKLNYAFAGGNGMDTLINTIQETYHIFINAYAYVNFDSFESIINQLGGIDVTLSEKEAQYLNTTNYISNPAYRTVSPGKNHLNGNQALGYCRVRKVPTYDGVFDDYGRTHRQRMVLNEIAQKYKNKNIITVSKVANSTLKKITTSMTSDNIYTLLSAYLDGKDKGIEQIMLPKEGYFDETIVPVVGAVLSIDNYRQQNIDYIHEVLYGAGE